MKKAYLHGELGKKFGKRFEFEIDSAQDLIAALSNNFEGFTNYLFDKEQEGVSYIVLNKDITCIKNAAEFRNSCANKTNYNLKSNNQEFHIVPMAAGGGPVAAAIAAVAKWWADATVLTKIMAIATATQIAITVLSKPPKPPQRKDPVSTKSFLMSGAVNRTSQGVAVPLGYGRLMVGSTNISARKKTFNLKRNSKSTNKNLLESFMSIELLDLVSEGAIAGPVNKNGVLISEQDIEESVFLNGVPIRNPKKDDGSKGSLNYILSESDRAGVTEENFVPKIKLGDNKNNLLSETARGIGITKDEDQVLFGGPPYVGSRAVSGGVYESTAAAQEAGAKIFTFAPSNVNVGQVEFSLRTRVARNDTTGNVNPHAIFFTILVVEDNEEVNLIDLANQQNSNYVLSSFGTIIQEDPGEGNGSGLFIAKTRSGEKCFVVRGIATSAYQFDIQIKFQDVNPSFKILKLSAETDPTVSDKNIGGIYVVRELAMTYVNEIIEENLVYPNSACVFLKFDSKNFSQIPKRSYHLKLKKILLPSNYDPISRKYDGPWNGKFKGEEEGSSLQSIPDNLREWSDNPAWIFFDLIHDARYGLGKYGLNETNIDKWRLYAIAKYCDELVETDYEIEAENSNESGFPIIFSSIINPDASEFFEISITDNYLSDEQFKKNFGEGVSFKGKKMAFFISQHSLGDENMHDIYENSKQRNGEIVIEERVIEETINSSRTIKLRGPDFSDNSAVFDFNLDFAAYVDHPDNNDLATAYLQQTSSRTISQWGEGHWLDVPGGTFGRNNPTRTPPPAFSTGAKKIILGACAVQKNHAIVEPRFSGNFYFTERSDALQMINLIASSFRAISSYIDGRITSIQDRPKKTSMIFNNSNVSPEGFSYSGVQKNKRISSVLIRFNNREKSFKPDVIYEEDADAIKSFGYIQEEIAAMGVTSESEARRFAKWILFTSQLETETVSFETSKEGAYLTPGSIIEISDEMRAGSDKSGRVLAVDANKILLDKNDNFSPSYKKIEIVIATGAGSSSIDSIQSKSSFETSIENQDEEINSLQVPQSLIFSGNLSVHVDEESRKGPQGQSTYLENLTLRMPVKFDTASNKILIRNHGFKEGDRVKFETEGVLPGGLSESYADNNALYVYDVEKNAFKVYAMTNSNRINIDISDIGRDIFLNKGGQHYVCPEDYEKTIKAINQIQAGSIYILHGLFDAGKNEIRSIEASRAQVMQQKLLLRSIPGIQTQEWFYSDFFGTLFLMDTGWGMINIAGSFKWVYLNQLIDRASSSCWIYFTPEKYGLGWVWFDASHPRLWYIKDLKLWVEVVFGNPDGNSNIDPEIMYLIAIDQHSQDPNKIFGEAVKDNGQMLQLKDTFFEIVNSETTSNSSQSFAFYVLKNSPRASFIPTKISSSVEQQFRSINQTFQESNLSENLFYRNVNIIDIELVDAGSSLSGRDAVRLQLISSHDNDLRNSYMVTIKDFDTSSSSFDGNFNEKEFRALYVSQDVIELQGSDEEKGLLENLSVVRFGSIEFFENFNSINQRIFEGQKFRVMSINEDNVGAFRITGLEYNIAKFSAAESKGVVRKPVLPIPPQADMGIPEAPENLILTDLSL